MDTPNATRANAALWAHYVDQRWGGALSPVGGVLASGLIGIAIANMYAAFWGDVIGRLFAANASQVTKFAQENVEDVLPTWSATPLPESDQDALPPWLRISLEDGELARVHAPEPLVVPV
jgi:hypothetical protein